METSEIGGFIAQVGFPIALATGLLYFIYRFFERLIVALEASNRTNGAVVEALKRIEPYLIRLEGK